MPRATTVARASVLMDADTSRLNRSLRNAEGAVDRTRRRIVTNLQNMARTGATALAGMSAAFVAASRASIDFADEIQKGAQFANLAAEDYQALQFALSQNGIEQTRLNNLLRGSANVINEARKGLATYTDILDDLNISQSQFSTTDQVQNLQVFLDALRNTEDVTLRNASAARIFGGRLGQTAISLVNNSANLIEYREQLERVGGLISQDVADSAAAANDAIDLLTRAIRAGFTEALLGTINTQGNFEERIRQIRDAVFNITTALARFTVFLIDNHRAILLLIQAYAVYRGVRGLLGVLSITRTFITQIGRAADASLRAERASRLWIVRLFQVRMATQAATAATAAHATATAATAGFFTRISTAISGFGARILAFLAPVGRFFATFGRFILVGVRFVPVLGQIVTAITAIVLAFQVWREGLAVTRLRLENFGLSILNSFNRVQLFILNLPAHFRNALNFISQLWSTAWTNIVNFWNATLMRIQTLLAPVLDVIANAWDNVVTRIRGAWDGLRDFMRMFWDDVVDFWTSGIDEIVAAFLDLPNRIRTAFNQAVQFVTDAVEPILMFLDRLRREPLTVLSEVATAVGRSVQQQLRNFLPFLFRSAQEVADDIAQVDERLAANRARIAEMLAQRTQQMQQEVADQNEMTAQSMAQSGMMLQTAADELLDNANDCIQDVLKTGQEELAELGTSACEMMDNVVGDDMVSEISIEAERTAETIVNAIRNGGWDMVGRDIIDIFADAAARQAEDALSMLLDNFFTAIGGLFSGGNQQAGGFFGQLFSGFGNNGGSFVGPQLPGAAGTGAGAASGALGFLSSFLSFHEGGLVPGRAGQQVPAVLEAGERVLTARQQRQLFENMQDNNSGMVINNRVEVVGNLENEQRRFLNRNQRELAITVQQQQEELRGNT